MILGAQFEQISGGTALNGLLTGLVGADADDYDNFTKLAPQIQIPNAAGGYTTRYYAQNGWYEDASIDGGWGQKEGWCDDLGVIAPIEFTPGEAMWLKSVETPTSANVSGQVPDSAEESIDCPAGFALRANVFPVAITLNDTNMIVDGLVGADADDYDNFTKLAPQIQIPNAAGGYTTRYYSKNGWYEDPAIDGGWGQKAGWCDDLGVIVNDVVIPVAQGFWTKGVESDFALKFKGVK